MDIVLYRNKSNNLVLDKNIIEITTLSGTLRNGVNILTPSIDVQNVEISDFSIIDSEGYMITDGTNDIVINNSMYTFLDCNYVYIPEFKRYYYVISLDILNYQLFRLNLSIDERMSYKDKILSSYAFVTRNEFTYNDYIVDKMTSFYYDKNVDEYAVVNGNLVNTTFKTYNNVGNFSVTTISNQQGTSIPLILSPDETILPRVSASATGSQWFSKTYALSYRGLQNLSIDLLDSDYSQYSSFILSIISFPFDIPNTTSGGLQGLPVSTTTLPNVSYNTLDYGISNYLVIADFTINGSSWLDYEPFSQYEIYIPYLSWIKVNADDVLNKRLIVTYSVDYSTGQAQVSLCDVTSHKIIYTSTCQLGINIPVNSTNAYEVANNKLLNNISLGLGLTSSALSMIVGGASANPVAVMGGLLSGGSVISNFVGNTNNNYERASGSVSSGYNGLYLSQKVRVRKTSCKPKDYDNNFSHLFGKPLNEYRLLSTLTGFTQIGGEHIDTFDGASDREMDMIKACLNEGIII